MKQLWLLFPVALLIVVALVASAGDPAGDAALGTQPYEAFETDATCAECHVDITRQHQQGMMSQSFTHHWDEIEYFELALPHSEKVEKVAGVKAGCNGCHAPLAFLAGDIPPKPPSEGTRANEGVSCDLCHSIVGFEGDVPFNFNWIVEPGDAVQGVRSGTESMGHEIQTNPFLKSAEFCGTCHNEKDPWGLFVKSTHLEWKEGPHGKAGIVCQDCHMAPVENLAEVARTLKRVENPGRAARQTEVRPHVSISETTRPPATAAVSGPATNRSFPSPAARFRATKRRGSIAAAAAFISTTTRGSTSPAPR